MRLDRVAEERPHDGVGDRPPAGALAGTEAVAAWKRALALDPANFVVRMQIWAHRHPEKVWPTIGFDWQQAEIAREQAGQSDLPPRPP
ncbi:MAG TPA: hypothetical protein VG370_14355 [Chloroflexota bacterium]|nr:hypothetical protein [Chloroflexota bacterium]